MDMDIRPFLGRIMKVNRNEEGLFIPIPKETLDRSGIFNSDEVEVIGHMDGTIAIRIATLCELCGRGSRLYELNMGPVNRKICAEDYFKLTGVSPQNLEKPTTENTTQIEQP
ncbi:hypothetical protein [Bacillus cereus]|uniref:hypothetical protein n=1 Tax=Bacillus cereus TaxID=1396 RepID=UPI000279D0E6|nr:hypothetical protein [Bacillus cereus]EJR89754.1 hypothetical protein IKG_06097 [Bacillus cereus VD200]EJR89756.1 hypothetical protein IKG_06044 [Bacillus cereus VD200]EJR96228.1 hypothetical protein IKG_03781 [Bacillus cereus VD200]